jgi:hypothetical protein
LYPDGKNAESAKTRLEELYQDSCEKANNAKGLVKADPTNEPKPEPKQDDKGKKEEKKAEKKEKDQDRNESTTVGTGEQYDSNNPKLKDSKGELKESKGELKESKGEPKDKLTPAEVKSGNNNLKESQEGSSGLSSAGNTQEEKDYNTIRPLINNNTVTLSDCKKYLKSHGPNENKEHWSHVAQKFAFLYKEKVKKCKTSGEVQAIIDNHDSEVKVLTIKGWNQYDTQLKEFAVAWKNKLVEKEKNAPSGSVGRLEPGIKAPSHPQ